MHKDDYGEVKERTQPTVHIRIMEGGYGGGGGLVCTYQRLLVGAPTYVVAVL